MDLTSIALHAVDSSIQHLNDSIESKWVDLLKALEIAASTAQELGVTGLISKKQEHYFLTILENCPGLAVIFNGCITDEKCVAWIKQVYNEHMEQE